MADKFIEIALKNLSKSINVLNDLKIIKTLENPFTKLNPVNLSSIIRQEIETVNQVYKQKNIHVEITTNNGKAEVMGNYLLSQLFQNLFANSVKHTEGKVVNIDITIRPIIYNDLDYIKVIIADRGKVIPPNIKLNIFNRKKLLEEGWSPSQNSSGFGMAIVKAIIDGYGGEISYHHRDENDWQKGTVVELLFPKGLSKL